ncbi:hypothetical protein OMK73_04980 [Cupriavidus sp. D39]|nr:hypothetical protein [Cupriavidus sp. D39]MCY0853248.1 hypothetical protein [Cupriavidus sp. D39]
MTPIQAQLQKALDDVAEIFIKVMRKFEPIAKSRLQQYQLAHADALEGLVSQFRDVLQVLQDDGIADIFRLQKVREFSGQGDPGGAGPDAGLSKLAPRVSANVFLSLTVSICSKRTITPKRVEGIETAVEAEGEFVEIGL